MLRMRRVLRRSGRSEKKRLSRRETASRVQRDDAVTHGRDDGNRPLVVGEQERVAGQLESGGLDGDVRAVHARQRKEAQPWPRHQRERTVGAELHRDATLGPLDCGPVLRDFAPRTREHDAGAERHPDRVAGHVVDHLCGRDRPVAFRQERLVVRRIVVRERVGHDDAVRHDPTTVAVPNSGSDTNTGVSDCGSTAVSMSMKLTS